MSYFISEHTINEVTKYLWDSIRKYNSLPADETPELYQKRLILRIKIITLLEVLGMEFEPDNITLK